MSQNETIEMRDADGNVILTDMSSSESYIITDLSSIVNVKEWC